MAKTSVEKVKLLTKFYDNRTSHNHAISTILLIICFSNSSRDLIVEKTSFSLYPYG